MPDVLLECEGVEKSYGGIRALKDASLEVLEGTVHGLVGHNGAGKSTLTQIVAGLTQPDAGLIRFGGEPITVTDRRAAIRHGILSVPQELTILPGLSLAENICIGNEPHAGPVLRWRAMRRKAAETLDLLHAELPERTPVDELLPSQQRIVMIAMALSRDCRLLILDEPTASLGSDEAAPLLDLVQRLPAAGVTVLYISHRLDEVVLLCDRVSVMRDGHVLETLERDEFDAPGLVARMVADLPDRVAKPVALQQREVSVRLESVSAGLLRNVDFEARAGAITAVTGLVGSGADDLLHVVAGVRRPTEGHLEIGDRRVTFRSPADALRNGVGYIAGTRALAGLRELTVRENVLASSFERSSIAGFTRRWVERKRAARFVKSLGLSDRLEDPLGNLSGGNQQKAIVARLLAADARVLVLNDPTAGVDVRARAELHRLLRQVAESGRTVIVRSSEPEELLDLADVIHVAAGGSIVRTFPAESIQLSELLAAVATSGHAAAGSAA